jgi:hypothetical protein
MNTPAKKENRLKLQKSTIVMLNESQMRQIRGGTPTATTLTDENTNTTSTLPICDTLTAIFDF